MKRGVWLAGLMLAAGPALADDVVVTTASLVRSGVVLRANFSAENKGSRALQSVFVDCTFFGPNEEPFTTEVGLIQNLNPGEKAFGAASVVNAPPVIKTAQCRFSHAF
jgi:hypothetical protein